MIIEVIHKMEGLSKIEAVGFICSTRIQYKKDDNELTHPVLSDYRI